MGLYVELESGDKREEEGEEELHREGEHRRSVVTVVIVLVAIPDSVSPPLCFVWTRRRFAGVFAVDSAHRNLGGMLLGFDIFFRRSLRSKFLEIYTPLYNTKMSC